ncbi:hypothetical protein [Lelliottia wanjuensis]|uniref:Uncharacterized protein n=1 Tax=Lelliottia wanjuensis TaxID=3050585 RepID=A0AAP4D1N5_9ENTR|nr:MULTISPECIES: hypothetical protein [unclassified Lelliottia]MDK9363402.1 hypothetical protein [Lelliottia sp. V106_12]MDK9585526.1 hypothetical protein [Lelliottia sp. V86_10]MDK9617044.1 hypothetical protein [Lelliottia sp. V106_9]
MNTNIVDEHQFHDNLIRGVIFASEVGDFSSDIHFDIDHIVKWVHCSVKEGESLFSVSRALLKFHDVSDLNLDISWGNTQYTKYAGYSSGIYILDIIKRKIESPLAPRAENYYEWEILTTNKNSIIKFGASSMSLELIGAPMTVNRQYLLNDERK